MEIDKYNYLYYYEGLLNDYIGRMFTEGIDLKDYYRLGKILDDIDLIKREAYSDLINYKKDYSNNQNCKYYNKINEETNFLEQIKDLYDRFKYIHYKYSNSYITLKEFLHRNCSLMHLVYTNNTFKKIRLYSYSSFMFLCQFHKERTPSLGISENKNLGYCFGCGIGFNEVDYIMIYENLSFHEAVSLLSKIYLIDINNNIYSDDDPLVLKYRNVLLSEEFKDLLKKGYERTKKRDLENPTLGNFEVNGSYEKDFLTIERIRKGEHISYQDEVLSKKLILQMPNFYNHNI